MRSAGNGRGSWDARVRAGRARAPWFPGRRERALALEGRKACAKSLEGCGRDGIESGREGWDLPCELSANTYLCARHAR